MRWILAGVAILLVLQGQSSAPGNAGNVATASSHVQVEALFPSEASAPGVFNADLDIPVPCGSYSLGFSEPTDEPEAEVEPDQMLPPQSGVIIETYLPDALAK